MKASKTTFSLVVCLSSVVSIESLTTIASTTNECKSGAFETTCTVMLAPIPYNTTARIKSNPTAIKSNPTTIQSNPTTIQSNPTTIKSNPTTIQSNPTTVKSNPTTRSTRLRSSPSITLAPQSQLPPIIPSNSRVGNASPESILERFQYLSLQHTVTYSHPTHSQNRTTHGNVHSSSFQDKLQNAVLASSNDAATSLTNQKNDTSVDNFPWKKALSTVGLITIGATIATTFFLISAPELLPDPSTTAAKAKELIQWLSSSILLRPLPPSRTNLNLSIHRFHTYFVTKFLPTAIPTLKTMAIMEIWRQIWSWTFRTGGKLYKSVFKRPYSSSLWRRYVPTFIRLGVKRMGVKATQKWIEGMLEQMVGGLPALDWGSFGDFDPNGGGGYSITGDDQLMAVPAS